MEWSRLLFADWPKCRSQVPFAVLPSTVGTRNHTLYFPAPLITKWIYDSVWTDNVKDESFRGLLWHEKSHWIYVFYVFDHEHCFLSLNEVLMLGVPASTCQLWVFNESKMPTHRVWQSTWGKMCRLLMTSLLCLSSWRTFSSRQGKIWKESVNWFLKLFNKIMQLDVLVMENWEMHLDKETKINSYITSTSKNDNSWLSVCF